MPEVPIRLCFDRHEFVTRGVGPAAVALAEGVDLRIFASAAQGAEGLCTGMAIVQPAAELPYHYHSCGEVITVLQGSAEAEIEGRRYQLGRYDALYIPPNVHHSVRNRGSQRSLLHVSFPHPTPDRFVIDVTYDAEPRQDTSDSTPEKLTRFDSAPPYALAAKTAFRDLFARRFGSRGVCGGYGLFPPGASLPCHFHDYDESISIIEGEAICQVAGQEYTLSDNDTACIPRGRPHRFINRSDRPMAMIWVYAGDEPDRVILEQHLCEHRPGT